ncbi:hypothetical protein KXV43_007112 [Aspergillus fumigatus]|nr:hypothetical protein KXV43_007112 [Aspergillus fumigatus]
MKAEETSSEHPAPCNPWQNRASGKTEASNKKVKAAEFKSVLPTLITASTFVSGPVGTPVIELLRRMDLLGSLTLMGAFAVGVIGVNFAGAMYP